MKFGNIYDWGTVWGNTMNDTHHMTSQIPMPEIPADMTPAERELQHKKMMAVREATFEVMSEIKEEVVKRARAKLVAMGIMITDDEVRL